MLEKLSDYITVRRLPEEARRTFCVSSPFLLVFLCHVLRLPYVSRLTFSRLSVFYADLSCVKLLYRFGFDICCHQQVRHVHDQNKQILLIAYGYLCSWCRSWASCSGCPTSGICVHFAAHLFWRRGRCVA